VAVVALVSTSLLVVGMPSAAATTQNLTVALTGTGSGAVTSTPSGIDCPGTCAFDFNAGDPVSLAANADPSSLFDHWEGDCSGTGSCDLTMDVDHAVTAVFTLRSQTLTVNTAGTGSGTVSSTPAGISCGANCSQGYDYGTDVSLQADAAASSTFDHWSGDCSGGGTCDVVMNADHAVTAVFTLRTQTLTVNTAGTGSGTVSSTPAGISCGANCSQGYDYGTDVSLQADPAVSSTFDHWSGDCSGGGTCDVVMNGDQAVTAVFTLKLRSLDVTESGNGSGTVTGAPPGINCAPTCSHNYNHGDGVTLTATPDTGSLFDHWSGDCTGTTSTCDLIMTQDRTLSATFTLRRLVLTVRKGGNGNGIVTSSPAGINCRIACGELANDFDFGTTVTLHAFAGLGARFSGWRGACTGLGPCVVPMTSRRLVTAVFSSVCGRIAFVSTRTGNDDIFTMNPDGTRTVNVTKSPANDTDPAWSPDCSRIAFVSDRGGNPDIYVINADGTGIRRVTSSLTDDTQPTWSPAGNRIAYTRSVGANGDLYVVAPDGSHRRRLTSGAADDFRPDWSPNGRRIVFVSTRSGGQQIFTILAGGGGVVQITHSRGQNLQPAWAPSGRRLAFVSTRDGNRELYIARASGSGVVRLTHDPGIDAHPSWSPGGAHIAFYTTRSGNDEVFAINANGTRAVNLSKNPASDTGPVWSS